MAAWFEASLNVVPVANEGYTDSRLATVDLAYFQNTRPEVVALIPPHAKRMLDIGCGSGAMALEAKRRGLSFVCGIEMNPAVAEIARHALDSISVGDVEKLEIPWRDLDCIVCADVLEHLADPWALLRRLRAHLKKDGKVIASIPNLAHHTAVLDILRDRFEYKDGGILDRTHLRFFTKHTIKTLFSSSGYEIERINANYTHGLKDKALVAISFGALRHLTVFQYLVVAKAAALPLTHPA